MPKRELKSLLSTERVLDYDNFHLLPPDLKINKDNNNVSFSRGGYGLEDWEWSIIVFHDKDSEGFGTTLYVCPPTVSRVINSIVEIWVNSEISELQAKLQQLLGIK